MKWDILDGQDFNFEDLFDKKLIKILTEIAQELEIKKMRISKTNFGDDFIPYRRIFINRQLLKSKISLELMQDLNSFSIIDPEKEVKKILKLSIKQELYGQKNI